MELVGVAMPIENTEAMAEAVIEEYLLMGYNPKQVMFLFANPTFTMTHQIYHDRGEAYVQERIRAVVDRWAQGRRLGGEQHA